MHSRIQSGARAGNVLFRPFYRILGQETVYELTAVSDVLCQSSAHIDLKNVPRAS